MSMSEKIIVVIESDKDGNTKKDIRLGPTADEECTKLELTPTKFVQEVNRKLKKALKR